MIEYSPNYSPFSKKESTFKLPTKLGLFLSSLALCLATNSKPANAEDQTWKNKVDPVLIGTMLASADANAENYTFDSQSNLQDIFVSIKENELVTSNLATPEQVWNQLEEQTIFNEEFMDSLGYEESECFTIAPICTIPEISLEPSEIELLANNPNITYISADTDIKLDPNAKENSNIPQKLYNLDSIGAYYAHQMGISGQGVYVANFDTGVNVEHDALKDSFSGYYYDAYNKVDFTSGPYPYPYFGSHGTNTMGVIVGKEIGVAPDAQWIGIKTCDLTRCGRAAILAGGDWLAALAVAKNFERVVVNMSFSGATPSAAFAFYDPMLENLINLGILPVSSAGNTGPNCGTVGYPGTSEKSLLMVGSVTSSNHIMITSSRGIKGKETRSLITAPGSIILTSDAPDIQAELTYESKSMYEYLSGTSMATPHVAGTAALIWSIDENKDKTPKEIADLIKDHATDTDSNNIAFDQCGVWEGGNNVYGNGILNIKNILDSQGIFPDKTWFLPLIKKDHWKNFAPHILSSK